MPLSKHYGARGAKVMRAMKKTYSSDAKAERVFYATEQKRKKEPPSMKSLNRARAKRG